MTTPTVASPSPAAPLSLAQQIQAANQAAAAGTSTTKTATGTTAIDLTGLSPQIQLMLSQAGIDPTKSWTGTTLSNALASIHNPALVSNIQEMLFYSGAYPTSITDKSQLALGSFGAKDATALVKAVNDAGTTAQAFGTYLNQSANIGKAQGILTQITAPKGVVALPNALDENAVLKAQAESILGRDPDPSDLAKFQAFYNAAVLQGSKAAAAAAAQNTPGLPDVDTLGTAIGDTQQNPDGSFTSTLTNPGNAVPGGIARPGVKGATAAQQQAAAGYYNQATTDANAIGAVTQAGAASDAAPISTYQSAPDMTAAADQFLTQNHPGQVQAQNYADVTKSLYAILGGSGT